MAAIYLVFSFIKILKILTQLKYLFMIKLLGKKGQYHAVVIAENGEVLSTTETEIQKQSVLKNLSAQLGQFGGTMKEVHDYSKN